jgi:GTP-binding nuclear protein Ran
MAAISPAIPMPTFKVVLVGDGPTGKTTYTRRLVAGEIPASYVPTLGVEVHPFRICVRGADGVRRPVCFNLWDTAGQERYGGLKDGYFIQASAALVFANPRRSGADAVKNVKTHIRDVYRVSPNALYYVVHSRLNQGPEAERLTLATTASVVGESTICSRTNHNLLTPFLELARVLLGDPTLQVVDYDPVTPPVVRKEDVLAAMRASVERAKSEYQRHLDNLRHYQAAQSLAEQTPLPDEIGV